LIYISIILYKDIFEKKTFGGKSLSDKLLAISSLVFVSLGDFLDIFLGRFIGKIFWPSLASLARR
jgi:hypothetical protein